MPLGERGIPPEDPGHWLIAARRDPDQFGTFYHRTCDGLFAFFLGQSLCPEIAADLAAETYAQALTSLYRFNPAKGTATQWLYGIARNQLRSWRRDGCVEDRARRRLGMPIDSFDEESFDRIEALVDLSPMRAMMRAALAELSANDRQLIGWRVVDQLGYEVIADRLGCLRGTARVRVSRALAGLRRQLDQLSSETATT